MHNPLADVPIPILDDLIESDYVRSLVVGTTAVLGLLGLLGLLLPGSIAGDLAGIVFSTSTAASTARLAAPIVLAGSAVSSPRSPASSTSGWRDC